MSTLNPPFWRTCRVIANETRLKLLWKIFGDGTLCVAELGRFVGISEQNASIQLRVLNAGGFIAARWDRIKIIYTAEANPDVDGAVELLVALRECFDKRISIESVIRTATAFTHPRRIRLVHALSEGKLGFGDLKKKTGFSGAALSLHISKLTDRRFVAFYKNLYRLNVPKDSLGMCLLKIIQSGECSNQAQDEAL